LTQPSKRRRGKKAKPERLEEIPEQWKKISLEQRTIEAERAAALIESGYGSIRW